MYKAMCGGLVLAALMLARVAAPDPALAQDKKEVKDKVVKDKKDVTKPATGGVIEISEGKDEKFRFFVRDAEGKLLAMSGPGGFATAKDAQAAIETLKQVVAKAKVTTLKKKDE